ncbi:hypothetical protein C7212DRAFT_355972 [Tuber magnatum]|uniref:Uncharacterized protein n=1 Tax=Tuber magnatum TaxID=42249 RepID=A0A317T3Y5_9PEZI|nr:hypothetical protein C7212DRAFT_355972 [Tuber magnatum]
MSSLEVHPHSQTPFSTPANNLLWTPSPSPATSAAKAEPQTPLLTLSAANYTSLHTYITTTTALPQSYEAYKTLYPDVLSPLTASNLYSRTGQTLVSTAALTRSYQLSFSGISSIAGAIIGFATEARQWYPRLQTQLQGLDSTPVEARQGQEWEGRKGAAVMVLKVLSNQAEMKEEKIGVILAQFTSLRAETLHLKSTIQGITEELSNLQDVITRESADRSAKLQTLQIQRALVEEERSERNRERNRALLGLGYMFVDPLFGLLTTAATVSNIQSTYESKRRERNNLDDEINAAHHGLAGLERATITTGSLEHTLTGILSAVDPFLQVCASIKSTFRTMQTNFELVSASLHATCDSAAGNGFSWAIEDLQRACEVWERITERAYEFQSEEFLKVCVRKEV